MIETEEQLVAAYLAGKLDAAGIDLAELLILTDPKAAALVEAAMDARDAADRAAHSSERDRVDL
ncbi:MAG: hypothetical protein ABIR16_02355 [Dokdonella sp.]